MTKEKKKKTKNSEIRVDSGGIEEEVIEEHSFMKKKKKKSGEDEEIARCEREKFVGDVVVKMKSKKKFKEKRVDSQAENDVKMMNKKKYGDDETENIEVTNVCIDDVSRKIGKSKRDDCDLGAEENRDKEEVRRISKKKKLSVDSEVEEINFNSTKDAKKKSKEKKKKKKKDRKGEENDLKSVNDAKKEKKKKRESVDLEVEENNWNSTKEAKKKRQSEDSEVEENSLNSTKDAEKKRKKKKRQSEDTEADENSLNSTKYAKKKKKKKMQSEDSEAEENNLNSTEDAKKKRKKKQKCGENDKDVTTPVSKSAKKVKFAEQLEVFPTEEKSKLVRGKRFTEEEDALLKNAVLEYVDNHALGDEGVKMVMECKLHPQLKGCWKEISSAIPWRAYDSVYHRAHMIFEAGSKGTWTKEDMELVMDYQKKHGNDWRTLADAMGKSRKHVKDAWRRMRLESKNKGSWTREEYQNLFDLVNKDLKMKAFQEKHLKHGMLRDNIPWMAVSDQLGSRGHTECCVKWYNQLLSPLVAKGIWANVDDYRLVEELLKLDAACIDDVDWDNLLDNRDGEACRKRWDQMVKHIGSPQSKTFAEQVEILSERYCPDLAEDREDFDNRPYDPEG